MYVNAVDPGFDCNIEFKSVFKQQSRIVNTKAQSKVQRLLYFLIKSVFLCIGFHLFILYFKSPVVFNWRNSAELPASFCSMFLLSSHQTPLTIFVLSPQRQITFLALLRKLHEPY